LAITVIGNFTLIPIIGIDGAAWTTLVSYMAMTIISIILGQLSYKIPYDFKKIFLYLISASILGWIASENMSNYFYSFGAMFIMISIVLFSERKFLMRSVK